MKDLLGIICSSLCLVHCLATPIILALGVSGLLATILTTEFIHYILIVPVGLLILLTLPTAYKRYGVFSPILIGVLGMIFLIAALFLGEEKEALLTIIGGSLLVAFHLWNFQLQHKNKINRTDESRLMIQLTGECLLNSPTAEEAVEIKNLNINNEKRGVNYARK